MKLKYEMKNDNIYIYIIESWYKIFLKNKDNYSTWSKNTEWVMIIIEKKIKMNNNNWRNQERVQMISLK